MGLDIIRWLDVVGMSHLVSSVMTKMNRSSMDSMMDRSMDWGMCCMMYWSMDGMDSVNRRGRDGLIVHGGSSIERGVNYWHRMSWFIHRWGHHCMGLLTYVLVDRGWLGFCY